MAANEGGEFFNQRPFLDFYCTLDNSYLFFLSLAHYVYPTLTVRHLEIDKNSTVR